LLTNVENYHGKRSWLSKANITNRKTIQIEWGDCDPAQIVHYPHYLAHFCACTAALFKTVVYAGAPAANTGFQIVTEQIKR
jgi:acyl-CoA thioesterase FadM